MEVMSKRLTREELDAKHRTWDAWGLSKEEQAELVRIFGLEPEPEPGMVGTPASERVSQPRASSPRPPKDTSRRTRTGRITKNAAQSQSVANRGTRSRSRRAAPTPAEVSMSSPQSKRVRLAPDHPDDNTTQVLPKTRKTQSKVCKEASDVIEDEVLQPNIVSEDNERCIRRSEQAKDSQNEV